MKIDIEDTASAKLSAMVARVKDSKALMTLFGRHMVTSVRQNFDKGGRPSWDPLKNVEVGPKGSRSKRYKRVQGRTRAGGPLVLSGDLRSTVGFTAEDTDLVLYSAPHEDPVKAAVHQWGVPDTEHGGSGKLAGRGNTVAIPARPFLMFQPEDIEWFRKSLAGWVRVGALRGSE